MKRVNILLVDDDVNVLESLQFGVAYSSLGIEKIYVAENAADAKKILKNVPIHIMVTDIEMPNESGIELLKWTKTQNLDVVTIFCTCYADFNYAKKAVELQCFDYYLKPISFDDFEKIISRAVEKVRQESRKKTYYQYEEEERFQNLTSTMSEFIIKNVVTEIFSDMCNMETIVKYGEDTYVIVTRNLKENAEMVLKKLIMQCDIHLNCRMRVFYDLECPLPAVKECFERLIHIWNENISNDVQIFWARTYQREENTYSFGAIGEWEIYLNTGAVNKILDEIDHYFSEKKRHHGLTSYELKAMQVNLIQMVNTVLMKNNIEAHELFVNTEYETYRKMSLKNYDNYMEFCKYLLQKAYSYIDYVRENTSIVEVVKKYIEEHYNEEISRNELAGIVYLNADYLARLFKKEEGISITDYVIRMRIKKASELLQYSEISINEIAMKVGYDNFSYFSRLCKKMLGCSPKDYRKKAKEKLNE